MAFQRKVERVQFCSTSGFDLTNSGYSRLHQLLWLAWVRNKPIVFFCLGHNHLNGIRVTDIATRPMPSTNAKVHLRVIETAC